MSLAPSFGNLSNTSISSPPSNTSSKSLPSSSFRFPEKEPDKAEVHSMVVIQTEDHSLHHEDHHDDGDESHLMAPLQKQKKGEKEGEGEEEEFHERDHLNGVVGALSKEASYRHDLSALYRKDYAPVAAAAAAAAAAALAGEKADTSSSSSSSSSSKGAAAALAAANALTPPPPPLPFSTKPGGPAELRIFKAVAETAESLVSGAEHKCKMSFDRRMLFSFLAGIFVVYGGALAITVAKGSTATDPGIQKLLFGSCFHVALVMIVLFGAELFTGNCMGLTLAWLSGTITWKDYFKGLLVSYFFNFLGCLFGAAFFCYYTELFVAEPWLTAVKAIAEKKIHLAPHVIFLRAIPANWLVCMAVFMATSADSIEGKVIGCYLPVMTFAAISYEHCIANMFFIPLGMMYGAEVSVSQFIVRNLLLSTLGNWIGGAIGMACPIFFLYLKKGSVFDFLKKKK